MVDTRYYNATYFLQEKMKRIFNSSSSIFGLLLSFLLLSEVFSDIIMKLNIDYYVEVGFDKMQHLSAIKYNQSILYSSLDIERKSLINNITWNIIPICQEIP